MNRDYISTVSSETELQDFDRYLLFRGERSSKMYKTLEHVAAKHMDMLAVTHIEELDSSNVSWMFNETLVETFSGSDDEEAVESWIRQHLVDSEPVPQKAVAEDGCVHVVASTFESQVLRSDTDVFFLVYAPWCGYSRQVLPEWSRLASDARHGLMVAKMDGDQNIIDTAEYKWTAFPQIVYFRGGNRRPLLYEGDRTAEAFTAFAEKQQNADTDSVQFLQPRLRGGVGLAQGFLQRRSTG